jgi:hypothetical protein
MATFDDFPYPAIETPSPDERRHCGDMATLRGDLSPPSPRRHQGFGDANSQSPQGNPTVVASVATIRVGAHVAKRLAWAPITRPAAPIIRKRPERRNKPGGRVPWTEAQLCIIAEGLDDGLGGEHIARRLAHVGCITSRTSVLRAIEKHELTKLHGPEAEEGEAAPRTHQP